MLVVLYFVPLADVLLTSVTDPKPGLGNYALLFTSASVQTDAGDDACASPPSRRSFALLLGYVVAYAMRAATHAAAAIMLFCVLLPFWISVLVRSFAWLDAAAARRALVNRPLIGMGPDRRAAGAGAQRDRRADRHGPRHAAATPS